MRSIVDLRWWFSSSFKWFLVVFHWVIIGCRLKTTELCLGRIADNEDGTYGIQAAVDRENHFICATPQKQVRSDLLRV